MRDRITTWIRRHVTPWYWLLMALAALEIAWLLFPPPQSVIERWYSLGLYPLVSRVIVPIQNLLPVPLTAIAIVLALTGAVAWGAYAWRDERRKGRPRWRFALRALGLAAQCLVLFLLWTLVVWGAGYQRIPVTERWSLDDANFTDDEASRLRADLLAIIHANVAEAHTVPRKAAVEAIATSMQQFLHGRGDGPVRVPRQVRATPPGLFLAFSTAGMCAPAAIEPFVDGAYDDVGFVRVAAHELAHVAGYNRESEATLIGYLAGLAADNALSRYAVALDIYMDLTSRIRDQEVRKATWEALPEQARDDVRIGREIANRYRIRVEFFQRLGYRVYDTYLKSQGIEEGIANYSAGLRLFAGAWRSGLAVLAAPAQLRSEVT